MPKQNDVSTDRGFEAKAVLRPAPTTAYDVTNNGIYALEAFTRKEGNAK